MKKNSVISDTQVLIADDNLALARVVAERFACHGLAPVICQDGAQAWRVFQSHSISVVVSDFEMPGLKGTELCRRIQLVKPELPFFLVTARESCLRSEGQLEGLRIKRVFSKPFCFDDLLAAVEGAIRSVQRSY